MPQIFTNIVSASWQRLRGRPRANRANAFAGSAARISDEPTSARRYPFAATASMSATLPMPLSATVGRCRGRCGASSANRSKRTSRSRRSRQFTPANTGGPLEVGAIIRRKPLEIGAVERLEQHEQAAAPRAVDERAHRCVVEHREDHEHAARPRRARLRAPGTGPSGNPCASPGGARPPTASPRRRDARACRGTPWAR